ncbi:MAG: hypothetical protein ABUT39_25175 [Acidobacteriota bacterium]
MRDDRHETLTRWLDAEHADSDDAAEAALLELFESLPPLAPPAGFADRVMRRVALEPAAPARRSWHPRILRAAVAFGVLATALSLLWVPELLMVLGRMVSMGDILGLGTASVVDLGRWLALAARIGEGILTVAGAFAVSLTSPAALKVTAACLAVSGISFVVLRDLMTRNRSWRYVDPIR